MSYSNFNTFKLFENVGINSSSDYMLSMRPNDNNVSFHSSNSIDYNNVDIMSIKNIINKKQNEDLNLSSLNGTTINPVITINNNHSDCRIMTNLNVAGNVNITQNLNILNKVGINTTDPRSVLQIGSDTDSALLSTTGIVPETNSLVICQPFINSLTTKSVIDLLAMGSSNVTYGQRAQIKLGRWNIPIYGESYDSSTRLDFDLQGNNNQTGDLTNVMTLKADGTNGYVGIGTNNPYCNLDVNGSIGVNLRSGYEGFSTLKTNSIQINHAEGSPNTTFYNNEDLRLSNTLTIFSPHMSNNAGWPGSGSRTDGGGTLEGHPMIDLITVGAENVGYGLRTTIKLFWAGSNSSWGTTSSSYLGFHMKNGSNSTEYLGNLYTAAVYFKSNGDVVSNTNSYSSDDRIKTDEELIINATNTLLKLRPQKYKKHFNSSYTIECGLIAQEIYYEVPELRYIIDIPEDAVLIDDNKHRNFEDIRNDPDYSNWGSRNATVSYNNLIGYLIRGFQEQQTEINTLKTENIELKSIIDKLKTANSFEEFKQTL